MANESDRISAADTLVKLERRLGGSSAAKETMADMLYDGRLSAWAERAFTSTAVDINEAWRSREIEGAEFEENIELERATWRGSIDWIDDVAIWRWPESRFVITQRRRPIERYFLENVTFSLSQIEQLLADEPSNLPPVKRGGGAPPSLKRWEWFWIEVVKIARKGELTFDEYQSAEALRRALLEKMDEVHPNDQPLSNDTIKPQVARIWHAFCDPNAD